MNDTTGRQALLACMNTLSYTRGMTRVLRPLATTPMDAFAGATTGCVDDSPAPDTARSPDTRKLSGQS
jgi:hypothetical protein